ncbi:MAG: endonuclease [Flavobacteriales bacterium]|nr:endonuclease [Flavobacteriales bacterium]
MTTLIVAIVSVAAYAQPAPPSGVYLEDLRVWLKSNWYNGYHSSLGYNEGRRQMYGYTDILSDGNIEGIYTGFQQAGGFVTYPNPINAEHIVPQSFFGSSEPMRSDIYILRPAHGSANSARSNSPFAEVNDNQAQWYGVNGNSYTSTGNQPANSDNWSEGSGSSWEPRESKKGDVARAVFYFYTMYPNEGTSITACGDLATLYNWHVNDPPDAAEISRNTKINQVQGNKNPYVEFPELVYSAWLYDGTPPPTDDTTGPDFTGTPASVSVACGSDPGVLADPTDPCGVESLTYEDAFSGSGGCTGGTGILRTYTAVDGCGNTSTFVQELVFVDTTAPVFDFVPVDLDILCSDDNIPLDLATATDDCTDATVTVSLDIVGGPCPEPYQIVRVFTATDGCGNTATASQTIFVTNDPPTGCPEDLDGDLFIGVSDVLAALGEFGCTSGCPIDLDGDGATTVNDILTLLSSFGEECP